MTTCMQKLFHSISLLSTWRGLMFILVLVAVLRVPTLFEPVWYGDESISLVVGRAIRSSAVLYKDIHDNKTPFLYLIAGFAYSLPIFKSILAVWNIASIVLFWTLSRLIFLAELTKNSTKLQSLAPFVSTLFFALLTTIPWWEGNIANGEIFMIGPSVAAMCFVWIYVHKSALGKKTSNWMLWFAGFSLALAFLFKHPAITDGVAIVLFLWAASPSLKISPKFFRQLLSLASGFLVPVVITLIFFVVIGSFNDFLSSVIIQNFSYLSSWSTGAAVYQSNPTESTGLIIRAIVAIVASSGIVIFRRRLTHTDRLLYLWFIWSFFGATLSGRPYAHYLIQIIPPLSLIISRSIFFPQPRTITASLITIVSLLFTWMYIPFWTYPTWSYYGNALAYMAGKKTQAEYYQWFDPEVLTIYGVSAWISQRSHPTDRLYVWGDQPAIYLLTNKQPITKYITAYHTRDFNGHQQALSELKVSPPMYIIISTPAREFPGLFALIRQRYVPVRRISNYYIYQLKTSPNT